MSHSDTWRDQRERRFQLGRDQATEILKLLGVELDQVIYTPGSERTLVVTTYLDSPNRDYLRMVQESGGRVSLKVRVREYQPMFDDSDEPRMDVQDHCYLERKERIGDLRQKQRVKVAKRDLGRVLRRELSIGGEPSVVAALDAELAIRSLEPAVISIYERRVFGSDRGGLRVTYDERLRFHPAPAGLYDRHAALTPEVLGPDRGLGPPRILEIKEPSDATTPPWLATRLAGLPEVASYSKFRDGMGALDGSKPSRPLTRPLLAIK